MNRRAKARGRRFILIASASRSASSLSAARPIEIPISDDFAPTYYLCDLVTRPVAASVERLSGRVRLSLKAGDPRGAGDHMLDALDANPLAIALIAPDSLSGKLPMLALAEYPGLSASTVSFKARSCD